MHAADVIIASNRGPIGIRRDDSGVITASRGGGGLVSAMAGLAATPGTVWICAALSDVDREVAAAAPDGRLDQAGFPDAGAVQMLPVDASVLDAAYNQIANATLWFAHHELVDSLPDFDAGWRRRWSSYVVYNQLFAEAIAEAAAQQAKVLVQDYHLALLPAMLRAARPDLRIGHFTHTPWASPSTFGLLPSDIGAQLLAGMLGADSAGFHSPRWAREFIGCCENGLGADSRDDAITYDGRRTAVRVHPLGVEAGPLLARAAEPDVTERRTELATQIGDRRAIARVDRTEPSKNIVRGLEAFRDLLTRYPQHRERVVHVALAYPSRQDVAEYRDYTALVESRAEQVNAEFATDGWMPVLLSVVDDYPRSLATLSLGDVVLINPIRDGMNLVAKESVLLTGDAVIVLSSEAGAADQMAGAALLVDPYDVTATADALHAALTMPAEARERRHAELVRAATTLAPKQWLAEQLAALE